MSLSRKILLFVFIFTSLIINFACASSSKEKPKRTSQKEINDLVMRFNEKLDYLSDRVDQMETKGNDAIDAREIIANISRLIFESNENTDEKLNKMESILVQLKNATDCCHNGRSDDVWRGVTSLCEDKVATWANATSMQLKANLDRIDFCIKNEQKALNACDPNPCLYGGRCRLSSSGSQYECDCPKSRSGSRCQEDECRAEERCWRLKDTMYVIIETRLTWAEAKVKCEGLNMTLAMPKDEERTRFLRNQLRPIYTTFPYNHLWIGLKRDAGMPKGQWQWVDGSALGEYLGYQGFKSATGLQFGLLYVSADGLNMWSYSPDRKFYSICEKRLFNN